MKAVIILLCASMYHAAVLLAPYRNPDEYGASVQFKNQDMIGNYNFGYNEGHLSGGSFRRETGDAYGNKIGSYGLREADGRLRIVNYIADANGFRVSVDTNEPGVEPQDPASASINKPSVVASPAKPIVRAPIAPLIRAPVAPVVSSPFLQPAPVAPVLQTAPVAPVVQSIPSPYYSSVQYVPQAPVRAVLPPVQIPQRYVASLNVPAYTNAVVPYAPYKGYPSAGYTSPVVSGYYKPSPVYSKVQAPPPAVYGQIAIDPPRYISPQYGYMNGKSLPTYQPLGFS